MMTDLRIDRDRECGYAEVRLILDHRVIGTLDTQYEVVGLRIGVDPTLLGLSEPMPMGYYQIPEALRPLLAEARALLACTPSPVIGTSDEILASSRHEHPTGWGICPSCGTYCDGDCATR